MLCRGLNELYLSKANAINCPAVHQHRRQMQNVNNSSTCTTGLVQEFKSSLLTDTSSSTSSSNCSTSTSSSSVLY